MKKATLALSALALSPGLVLPPFSTTAAETSSATAAQQMPSFAPTPEEVMPSMTSINVEGNTTTNAPHIPCSFQQPFGDDSPLCQEGSPFQSSSFCQGGLGGNGGGQQQKSTTLGSDVIIDADESYAITNNHVVDNTTVVKVRLSDDRKLDVRMVGRDPRSSTALTQIQNPKNLVVTRMTDPNALRVGDYTVAVGNPFGLGGTVTSGVVSALGRSGLNVESYEGFTQTDAAINQSNSGGTLVNLNGRLIGINAAILAPDGGNIGIGFAIPSNMVKSLTSQTMEYGQVGRGELGIMGIELNPDLAKAMKVDAWYGAFISQVLPNSSAAKAGIKTGGMIASLNGRPISSFATLYTQVSIMSVGNKLTLSLLRDGKRVNMNLRLQQSNQNQVDPSTIFNSIEGVGVSSKDKDQGVVTDNVKTDTLAAQIDLKKGDVIIGASRRAVKNIAKLRKVLDSRPSALALNTQRGDSTIYLLIQ